nr:NADH dehydrogenase subunit 2 [Pectinopygus varius]
MTYFLIVSAVFSVSSASFLGVWVGLEVGALFFIPMVSSWNYPSKVASWKYFYVQAMGSMILISGILIPEHFSLNSVFSDSSLKEVLVLLGASVKLGLIPFHGWVLQIAESMSGKAFYFLNSWQKVSPLIVVWLHFSGMLVKLLVFASIWSVVGVKSTSMRWILAFSSMTNMGWILLGMSGSVSVMLTYLMCYMGMLTFILQEKSNTSSLLWGKVASNLHSRLAFTFFLMSASGLPPFLGFFMKLDVLISSFSAISVAVVTSSAVYVYAYFILFTGSLAKSPASTSTPSKMNSLMFPVILGGILYAF